MKRGTVAGAVFGAIFGLVTSSVAAGLMSGLSFGQWQRLPPTGQEIYVAGMLDAMGLYRVLHPVHTYRNLVSSEDCIQKTGVNAQQLAQGMAEYAKLKPSAFTPAGMSLPRHHWP